MQTADRFGAHISNPAGSPLARLSRGIRLACGDVVRPTASPSGTQILSTGTLRVLAWVLFPCVGKKGGHAHTRRSQPSHCGNQCSGEPVERRAPPTYCVVFRSTVGSREPPARSCHGKIGPAERLESQKAILRVRMSKSNHRSTSHRDCSQITARMSKSNRSGDPKAASLSARLPDRSKRQRRTSRLGEDKSVQKLPVEEIRVRILASRLLGYQVSDRKVHTRATTR